MASVTTTQSFLDAVRKSRLIDDRRLNEYLAELGPAAGAEDSRALAMRFVRDGLLTTFHCKQLLQGKWRGFFLLDKYKVLTLLGIGASGRVYLCEQTRLSRLVAIKILPSQQTNTPDGVERFYREARAVAALNHPNIVRVFDIDHDGKLHFMVLEYVDGSNLQDIIERHGAIDPGRASHFILQAAAGLQHAHEAGWVHRDIKPGNILLDRSGVVKILDLGLARLLHQNTDNLTLRHNQEGGILGTVDYIAPEQAMTSHSVDIRADIYSLGATFRFLLTGQTPFGEGSVTNKLLWHQLREPEPISRFRNDVPPELMNIITRMMAKNPDHRFQFPAEVVHSLLPYTTMGVGLPPEHWMPQRLNIRVSSGGPATSMGESPSQMNIQALMSSASALANQNGSSISVSARVPLGGGSGSGVLHNNPPSNGHSGLIARLPALPSAPASHGGHGSHGGQGPSSNPGSNGTGSDPGLNGHGDKQLRWRGVAVGGDVVDDTLDDDAPPSQALWNRLKHTFGSLWGNEKPPQ